MFKTRCYWDLGLLLVGVFVIVALGVTANDNQSASFAPSNAGGKKKGPVDHVFRTGQTVSYAPGDDGDLQAGVGGQAQQIPTMVLRGIGKSIAVKTMLRKKSAVSGLSEVQSLHENNQPFLK